MQQKTQVIYSYTVAFDASQLQEHYHVNLVHVEHFIKGFLKQLDNYFQGKVRYLKTENSLEFYCPTQEQQQDVRVICNQLFTGLTTMLLNPWFIEKVLTDVAVYDQILAEEAVKVLHNIDRVKEIGASRDEQPAKAA